LKIGEAPAGEEFQFQREQRGKIGLQCRSLTSRTGRTKIGVDPKHKRCRGEERRSGQPREPRGIKPGDLITAIDKPRFRMSSAFHQGDKVSAERKHVLIVLQREGRSFFVQMAVD